MVLYLLKYFYLVFHQSLKMKLRKRSKTSPKKIKYGLVRLFMIYVLFCNMWFYLWFWLYNDINLNELISLENESLRWHLINVYQFFIFSTSKEQFANYLKNDVIVLTYFPVQIITYCRPCLLDYVIMKNLLSKQNNLINDDGKLMTLQFSY